MFEITILRDLYCRSYRHHGGDDCDDDDDDYYGKPHAARVLTQVLYGRGQCRFVLIATTKIISFGLVEVM